MSFNESNTVEQLILDAVAGIGVGGNVVAEPLAGYGLPLKPSHWTFVPPTGITRQPGDVLVEGWLREALLKLNPEIAAQPDRADEVFYQLRAILLSVHSDGLVRANEHFTAWLRGEKTLPFGPNGEHVPIRLLDRENPGNNRLTVTNQWTYVAGSVNKRFDVVFLVNGIPLVIGEAKTPTRAAVTWFDGAYQVHQIYEKEVPAMFVPNVFSFATEGKCLRYGSIRMPLDLWGPWRDDAHQAEGELKHVKATVESLMRPEVVLDILQHFTLFSTDKKHRRIKQICRYQQFDTVNKMVARVVAGHPKKGLIWHFQGSGKSLLMVFAAQKLRLHPKLANPTVLIVVDRIDLDTQITATFNASDVPNMVRVDNRQDLQSLLKQDVRKVLITTIHKFGDQSAPDFQSGDVSPGKMPWDTLVPIDLLPGETLPRNFNLFDPYEEVKVSYDNLPHWRQEGKLQFVTWRLADSLPKEVLEQLRQERDAWTKRYGDTLPKDLPKAARKEYYRLFRERVQKWLDAGKGSCVLKQPKVKQIMEDALRHFDGQRYTLGTFTVAPNHVHVLVEPKPGIDLGEIMHSWKSFTANEINKVLGRKGQLWMDEYYDHLVRNEDSLKRIEAYIRAHDVMPQQDAGDTLEPKWPLHTARTITNQPWNTRSNIIVMVDEAHRTQEGDLGRQMRAALPNAFLFGLTGTPINRSDKNTFWAFGADEDEHGYMSRYSFQDSIRDKATLPLHFEAPEVKLKIDKAAIDEAFSQITDDLSEQERDDLAKRAAKMAVLVKNPERVQAVVRFIVEHFQKKVEPNNFKAQVVTFDRECCVLYKQVFDELLPPEASAVVFSSNQNDPKEWEAHKRDKDAEEKLLDNFRDPNHPLKFLIVTNKLLTGFDAPILQAMYLDKPMKDHNLLQAICRTNRVYGQEKTHGLIVDFIGIFDDVAKALHFDEKSMQQVVSNIDELRKALPIQMKACLDFFPNVDRTVGGYEGMLAAHEKVPTNETKDKFAAQMSVLISIWEALSPDQCLAPYAQDYKWLAAIYSSLHPTSGNGKLLWHMLGAKTIDLINENVHVEAVRDDLEALVLDTDKIEDVLKDLDAKKRAQQVEIRLVARLQKHKGNPKFTELGLRLEKIKERHEQGFLTSLEFLKEILDLAKDTVEAENAVDPEEDRDRAKEALTELFKEAKGTNTHIIVERIVSDIDAIVKKVRFDGWKTTSAGEREVQQALRRTLLKYQLHRDQELFDKAYGYIREYY
jgi:type I site-specific restriction-modification system R (restriction) subunit